MVYMIDDNITHRLYYRDMDDKALSQFLKDNKQMIDRREISISSTGHSFDSLMNGIKLK